MTGEWVARCLWDGCDKDVVTTAPILYVRRTVFLHHAQRCHPGLSQREQRDLADLLFDRSVQTALEREIIKERATVTGK